MKLFLRQLSASLLCAALGHPLCAQQNTVSTISVRVAGKTTESQLQTLLPKQGHTHITHFDGVGRPFLEINSNGGGASPQALGQSIEYDELGRIQAKSLPYGNFNTATPFYSQSGDKVANDTDPYLRSVYDDSPLNQVVEQGAAGADWQPGTSHTHKFVQRPNFANEVRLWVYDDVNLRWHSNWFYPWGELGVKETYDEHDALSVEYYDKNGRLVQKKTQVAQTAGSACYAQAEYVTGNNQLTITAPAGTRITGIRRATFGVPTSNNCATMTFNSNLSANVLAPVRDYLVSRVGYPASALSVPLDLQLLGDPASGYTKTLRIEVNLAPDTDEGFLLTQYAYDDFGQLRLVIPPAASQETVAAGLSTFTADAAFISKGCFSYEYDARHRMVSKYVPGGGITRYIYNERNQIALTVDAKGQWSFIKYDALGRIIMTGQYPNTRGYIYEQLRDEAKNIIPQWEDVVADPNNPSQLAYTLTNSFPYDITENNLLTRTYYDSYTFGPLTTKPFVPVNLAASAISSEPAQRSFVVSTDDQSNHVRGRKTGQQERVLGETTTPRTWLTTAWYYDHDGQLLQSAVDNYGGGEERTTVKLNFTGQVEQSYLQHAFPSNTAISSPFEQHTVYQENAYDHAGRPKRTWLKVDSQAKLLLSEMEYNALGQLVDKKLHSTDWREAEEAGVPPSFLQSVDYRYNIRGWLTSMNNSELSIGVSADDNQDTDADPDLFGFDLKYNQNFALSQSTPQFNGNIAEAVWKSNNPATQQKRRAYAYAYDQANRLKGAQYRANESGTWSTASTNYSVSGLEYDRNGNLLDLVRQGTANGVGQTPGLLDQLHYTYSTTNTNQLLGVNDGAGATPSVSHDYEGSYSAGATPQYEYDANGNLRVDRNKNITGITYNQLNLPELIQFTNDRSIRFFYTASGRKLRKEVRSPRKPVFGFMTYFVYPTDYLASGFVYESRELKFAPTPEGRMLYTYDPTNSVANDWKYEYFLRDHLGNLRFAFRNTYQGAEQRTATMEPANARKEEETFAHVAETRTYDPQRARTGNYVARLSAAAGRRVGPAVTWPVAAGDSVSAEVHGRYDRSPAVGKVLRRSALLSGLGTATSSAPVLAENGPTVRTRKQRLPYVGLSLALVPQLLRPKRDELPSAFLRYELYNKDSVLVASRMQPLIRTSTDEWQHLRTGMKADSAGYVKVALVNESGTPAYFDDLVLRPIDPAEFQENHYDPWGLNLVGIEDTGNPDSKFQYNGKEKQTDFGLNWSDYGARFYDSQIARWQSPDPLADKYMPITPFAYVANNPISGYDPDGKRIFWIGGAGNDQIGWDYTTKWANALRDGGINGFVRINASHDTPGGGMPIGDVMFTNFNRSSAYNVVPGYDPEHPMSSTRGTIPVRVPVNDKQLDKAYADIVTNLAKNPLSKGEQLNLMGYSYGSVMQAHLALRLAKAGYQVDNLILIGSPISDDSELMGTLKNTRNIGKVIRHDIKGDMLSNPRDMLTFIEGGLFQNRDPDNKGAGPHFDLARPGNETYERIRKTVVEWLKQQGVR